MIFILVFLTALVLALALTPLATLLSARTGAVDVPSPRRVNLKPMPSFGGLPVFFAFFVAVCVSLMYPRTDPNEPTRLAGLLLGSALMFIVGAYDDYHELRATPQLVAQFLAACIAVASGVLIREIPNPFGGTFVFETWFAVAFTLFWLMGMMNTINWLDGLDGLAAGVVVIAGIVMIVHTIELNQLSIALLAIALVGTLLGFLPFNFFPAKIFLGTAGALTLGFIVGNLSVIGGAKVATALLVLAIPILDVAWQIFNRLRAHRSPFSADRGHLHHRLLDLGISQRTIVTGYYVFTACFGVLALILPSGIYKLIALLIIGAGALLLLVKLGSKMEKPRG